MTPPVGQGKFQASCRNYATFSGQSMGTSWTIRCRLPGYRRPEALYAKVQAKLDDIVDQMSTWQDDSVLSTLNTSPTGWYQMPPDLFIVLRCALALAKDTHGAYDPTMGELVNLWGFGPKGKVDQPPHQDAIAGCMTRSGWQRTALNDVHRGVFQPGGLHFDLSSIAKGYGVDCMARTLESLDVFHYLVELGGEIRVRGVNGLGEPWALAIESPNPGQPNLPLTLQSGALATSGDYRRHFVHEGRHYAHTLDPSTGYPLSNGLASVSVVHAECMQADALATALLCLGLDKGMAYAETRGIAALFMIRVENDIAVEWTTSLNNILSSTKTTRSEV